jgi:hypothetical protein
MTLVYVFQVNLIWSLGWLHAVLITGVFAFGADGCIFWAKHNFPGSWNDAEMSRGFQERLLDPERTDARMCVMADTAFPSLQGKIISPLRSNDWEAVPAEVQQAVRRVSQQITFARQAAEWGMGAAEKIFRQLQLPLPFQPEVRALRLNTVCRLYNYRVRTTGISEIRSVYYGQ